MKKILTATMLMFLSAVALSEESSSESALAMKVFMGVCVPSGGSYSSVYMAVKPLGLTKLPSEKTHKFLGGAYGTVWATRDENGQFAISHQENGTCSVYVRKVSASELTQGFESWLPPPTSPFVVEKKFSELKDGVRTSTYAILRDGELYQSWVLMVSESSAHEIQGVLSVRPANFP